jgi:hypothetical protein
MLIHAWRRKGKIPGGGLLALSSQWKKTSSRTGARYWHSSRYGLSVSIQKKAAFVSDGDPFIEGPPVEAPENLEKLRLTEGQMTEGQKHALVLGWLENAGTPINNFISTLGLPVRIPAERILFALYETPDPADQGLMYEAALRIETQNASQARALTSILTLVRNLTGGAAPGVDREFLEILRPLLANPPGQDGSDLLIRTGPMTPGGIALLLSRFSVYSH